MFAGINVFWPFSDTGSGPKHIYAGEQKLSLFYYAVGVKFTHSIFQVL